MKQSNKEYHELNKCLICKCCTNKIHRHHIDYRKGKEKIIKICSSCHIKITFHLNKYPELKKYFPIGSREELKKEFVKEREKRVCEICKKNKLQSRQRKYCVPCGKGLFKPKFSKKELSRQKPYYFSKLPILNYGEMIHSINKMRITK